MLFIDDMSCESSQHDAQRRSMIECRLHDLELLFQDCPPNDGNGDGNGDGPYSNSTRSTHNSQHKPLEPCSPRRLSRDAVIPAYIKSAIGRAFKKEYDKVVGNVDSGVIFQEFPDFRSAWKSGISTLRKFCQCTDPPYPDFDFGSVIAMLCVCSAMSKTIDENNSRAQKFGRQGSYYGHFQHDLDQWGTVLGEILSNQNTIPYHLALLTTQTIWDVKVYIFPPSMDILLDLDFLLSEANKEDTASEAAWGPNNLQGTSGHCGSVRYTWPYRSDTGKTAFWTTSVAFSILIVFLTWLRATTAGLETSEISEFLLGSDLLLTRFNTSPFLEIFPTRVKGSDQVLRNFFKMYSEVNELEITQQRQTPNTAQESSHAPGDSGLTCRWCEKEFPNKQNRVRHEKDVHGPKEACERCGKEYTARGFRTHHCPTEELSGPQSKRQKTSGSTRNGG
ncbi:hypothetical protein F4680DRAFT_102573 [Xylaria scruposa]|nr:hypothetical protein F4680DRAFT_102573 [Xylaria scruposa]